MIVGKYKPEPAVCKCHEGIGFIMAHWPPEVRIPEKSAKDCDPGYKYQWDYFIPARNQSLVCDQSVMLQTLNKDLTAAACSLKMTR